MYNTSILTYKSDILLVDDNPQNLRLLRTMLREQGYKVRATVSGNLALKAVEVAQPDLILLDINLPDMKGYEVCEKLKNDPVNAEIPVIFISALDEVLDKIKAFEVGGVDYITKPFELKEVLVRVKNQLTIFYQKKQLTSQQDKLLEQNLYLQLLVTTTKKINEADDFHAALEATLYQVCETINWDLGEFWIPNKNNETVFEHGKIWYAKNPNFVDFIHQNDSLTLSTNKAILNQICSSQEPHWLTNIAVDDFNCFSHFQLAKEAGLKTCLGIPILFNDEVLAVLVFFKKELSQPEPRVIELVNVLATQLGSLIQRKRSESALRTLSKAERERTLQLEQALKQLQNAQAQLVQKEKMASLGQLIAGVAHEINNPASFIYGNIYLASEYSQDLLHLIKLYQKYYPNPATEINQELERIEPDFVATDFPKLIASMKEGAHRISNIVLSLRNFSRLDEAELKRVDIHEGIDNSLLILQHRLKQQSKRPEIQVIKEYGELPLIKCYPGQLNQVFLNILNNAIDALDGLNRDILLAKRQNINQDISDHLPNCTHSSSVSISPHLAVAVSDANNNDTKTSDNEQTNNLQPVTPCICIRTEAVADNKVIIRFIDNGSGISIGNQSRIFDPFFTTKPPGEGTGLGLSISYQIVVEKHKGQLNCNSTPSQGTELVIELPITQEIKD